MSGGHVMRTRNAIWTLIAGISATAASAQQPTIDQLLATPTAAEIVQRWKSVCFDHAGNIEAQIQAMKDTGLTWPYQMMTGRRGSKPYCMVLSSAKAGTAAADFLGPLSTAIGQPPAALKADGKGLETEVELSGKKYWIGVSLETPGGNLVSTIVIAVK